MSLQAMIMLAMQLSIIATIFGFGLEASRADLLYVVTRPGRLARSVFAMFVVMPLLAVALAQAFDFTPAVEIALVALAISPIPPLLPRKQDKAGGRASFALGLMVTMALLSIAFIPIACQLLGHFYGREFSMGLVPIVTLILKVVVLPLLAGMLFRRWQPRLADRIAKPMQIIATIVLTACALAIVVASWHAISAEAGNGTLVAIVAFILVGLVAGHLLGGPNPEDRTVLALSTSSRHPGIAIAMATANFPGNRAITAAILLYLLVNIVVSVPYVMWQRRRLRAAIPAAAS